MEKNRLEQEGLGIYIHIPFCVRKCNYCDFLSFPARQREQEEYVAALVQEIRRTKQRLPQLENRSVDTVFLGGGTPGLLSVGLLRAIMDAVYQIFSVKKDAEISMECNPGVADFDKLSGFYREGINRLSVGIQSAIDTELKELGRIHSFSDGVTCVRQARDAGFSNLNIDLMSGIPKQTVESYERTLEEILQLEPEHISAYSLIVEEKTPFYQLYGEEPPVDEDTDRVMYGTTKERLAQAGYERYEISNYAREGYACRHNLKYWSGQDYIGFGLGAASKLGATRYRNTEDIAQYIEEIRCGKDTMHVEENLNQKDQMAEFFLLGLRKCQGVSLLSFEQQFGIRPETVYGQVMSRYINEKALVLQGDQLRFTDYGLDVSNHILCEFLE